MTGRREYAPEGKVRYAAVGLGWITQVAFLPAFKNAKKNSELTALVSGEPEKLDKLGEKYDVELRYPYDEYEACLESGKVDAVYIGLPNDQHRKYTEPAAKHGVHVLCEKPMADSEEDCVAMIDACRAGGVKLMIAYRLHFEEANMTAVEIVQRGDLGEPRLFNSTFTQQVMQGNYRLDREHGGGPIADIGIYCINAMRYLFRAEPTECVAMQVIGSDPRFTEVPETVSAILRFPDHRLGSFTVSFGASDTASYRVVGTKGSLQMDPAYPFQSGLRLVTKIEGKAKERKFKHRDQFAAQLLYFSDCILEDREPEPSGAEGLADVRIISAIRRSARDGGRAVPIEPVTITQRPSLAQVVNRPAPSEPEMVDAASPSGEN